jgi:hypothetical protein
MSPETTDLLACAEKARAEAAVLRRAAARTLMWSRELMERVDRLEAERRRPCPRAFHGFWS